MAPAFIPTQTKTIGQTTWQLSPLPAEQALDLLGELFAVIGGAAGLLKTEGDELSGVGPALDKIAAQLALDGRLRKIVRALLHDLIKDGRWKVGEDAAQFNVTFAGSLSALVPLVRWALEMNFGDFFGLLGGLEGGLAARLGMMGTTSQESSGPTSSRTG